MNAKHLISFFAITIIIVLSVAGTSGCANIIPPQGGARDSLPPQLIKAEPADSSLNFKGNKIVLTFDEFIEVQNVSESLIFSPTPEISPYVEGKLRTVSIKLKDSLQPNTTYTINFGGSIIDFTEGNSFKDFTYTFSTGNYIDSLELTGKVILAETGKLDTNMIVMLHTSPDDSVLMKDKPAYITKLDGNGNFRFKNLPPRTFYLYALKDENRTRRYTTEDLLFAFANKPVVVPQQTASDTLYAFVAKPRESNNNSSANNRTKNTGTDKRLKYRSNSSDGQQDLLGEFFITTDQPLQVFNSSGLKLYTDSSFTPVPEFNFSIDSSNTKIVLTHKWKENTLYHLILDKDFAEDSVGNKLLKTDTLSFSTKKLTDYGSLKLKLRNLDLSKNPVLQIIKNDRLYQSFPMKTIDLFQELYLPGEYELRILYDSNKNGSWDPGEFFGKRLQPEIVKPIDRKIVVKPAWQNEIEIDIIN